MEKLLTTEQARARIQWGVGVPRTPELPMSGCQVTWDQAGVGSALSEQMNLWSGETLSAFALLPLLLKDRGDDSVIKKILIMQIKGDSFCRLFGFLDKCFRVHSCNFRWETWKGCKSFRHYIWNGVQWKPFRRDVWVKALRNVNLISLKPVTLNYWMWNLVYSAIKSSIFKNILQIFFAPLRPEPAGWR